VFEIGNSLREARLRQGLELPELEQATKIRARYLRALEEEQFEQLPAATYVKGFLRSYADYLGLDGQLYVDEYNTRYVVGEEEPVVRPRRSSAGRAHRPIESRVIVFALVGIAAVTALVIAAWKSGGSSEPQPIPNLGAASAPKKPVVKPAPPKKQHPAVPKQAHLVLAAARGDCWLEVHTGTADGKLAFVGTLDQGHKQRFTAKRLWIIAGAPQNLDATLNGERRAFPFGQPAVVTVTPRRIAKAPAAA
jgi:Helix-turn-helix domain/RodZ C-terminal domain